METLIIPVNCRSQNREGPPQLGITVEAPISQQRALQQLRKQQAAKDFRHHDYQNFHMLNGNYNNNNKHNNTNNIIHNNRDEHNLQVSSKLQQIGLTICDQIQEGLQITQIQEGSVIDRNGQFKIGDIIVEVNGVNLQRPFAEAQRTLKQFVVDHTSHGPLILKVLRKSESSSSLPSTTGSQATVIERNNNLTHAPISPISTSTAPKKTSISTKVTTNSTCSISPKTSSSSRHLVDALNTRKIGTKHRITLKKSSDGGFGIKIAERDNMYGTNKPIYITAITTTGSAYRDGRLREGDMLLKINGIDLAGKSQPEVTKMLKSVGVNEAVEFVVSRQENLQEKGNHDDKENDTNKQSTQGDCDMSKSLIDLDVPDQEDSVFSETNNHQFEEKVDSILNVSTIDGPGTYVYDIPLNDTKSAGLGLYLKYPRRSTDRKDLGIWIEKVITGGAAWKDGRLQPNDQIFAINGINLIDLSNAEASETLTAAVCRGIGPEATPNTIRLNIHRRDPAVVAKILHGTNNRIEHSDILATGQEKSNSISDDNSRESYKTALDNTLRNRSTKSIIDVSGSSGSSNQNSQNDSALSPQTQASNSLKLSNSCNDRSEHNSSDKTNDTSSAISQITDFTNVPINDNVTPDKNSSNDSDNQNAITSPKTLQLEDDLQSVDHASTQSWDDDSIDASTGEERFQRDGFGRQSISEKRHAQLMAKNTGTYRRNKKQREERERQCQLEEQLARQCLDDDRRLSFHLPVKEKKLPTSYTTSEFKSIYGLHTQVEPSKNQLDEPVQTYHREVPVDVHPIEPGIETGPLSRRARDNIQGGVQYNDYSDERARIQNHGMQNMDHRQILNNQMILQQMNPCLKCGSTGPCICGMGHVNMRTQAYGINSRYDQMLKRSNSLESIQQVHQVREGLIVPRAGTVRVARNRKVNESFRVAVDRSYEGSMNDSGCRHDCSETSENRRSMIGTKIASSIANSTTSTSNDERHLINRINNGSNSTTHKKSSSLLTKFLKFGSMKKSKKKNRDGQANSKPTEAKSTSKDISSRESETRSQSSLGSNSRTHSAQSHPNLGAYNHQHNHAHHIRPDALNGQLYHHNLKQSMLHSDQHLQTNGSDVHPHRASMPMCHYQPLHNLNTQHNQIHHHAMTQAKYAHNLTNRPANLLNNHQYSHVSLHHQGQTMVPPVTHSQHLAQHQIPLDIHNHPFHYTAPRAHMVHNPLVGISNGCQPSTNQWQPPPIHAPNGLWVANSPVSENQYHHHHHANSIYGTAPQRNVATSIQHRPSVPSNVTSQPVPFIPPVNGHNSSGIMHHQHQASVLQGQAPLTATTHHLHNQQPQHIYYYDF